MKISNEKGMVIIGLVMVVGVLIALYYASTLATAGLAAERRSLARKQLNAQEILQNAAVIIRDGYNLRASLDATGAACPERAVTIATSAPANANLCIPNNLCLDWDTETYNVGGGGGGGGGAPLQVCLSLLTDSGQTQIKLSLVPKKDMPKAEMEEWIDAFRSLAPESAPFSVPKAEAQLSIYNDRPAAPGGAIAAGAIVPPAAPVVCAAGAGNYTCFTLQLCIAGAAATCFPMESRLWISQVIAMPN